MARSISYDSHHSHQFQPEILHKWNFSEDRQPDTGTIPPEKNEKLILKEQPQLLMMDYGFSFRRKAVTGMWDWVSNSLLGFGAVLKCAFKTAERLRLLGLRMKDEAVVPSCCTLNRQLCSSVSAPSRKRTFRDRENLTRARGEGNERNWCCQGKNMAHGWGCHGWQHTAHFKKNKCFAKG